jgi:hypothetical protein
MPVLAFEARAHRVLGHHVIDRQVLADVAQELEEADAACPVGVVDDHGASGAAPEVQETRELRPDTGEVLRDLVVAEQVALDALARRIADHARGAADEDDRLVAGALQARLHDDGTRLPTCKLGNVGS